MGTVLSSSNILVEMRDVQYTYGESQKPTVRIPEFSIVRGEQLFLYGPSGTGKTTLLEMLAGVLKPQQGTLKILGCEFSQMSAAERDAFRAEHMGYVFQNFNLIPYLTAQENIELPLHLSAGRRARLGSVDTVMVIRALFGNLGIGDVLGKKVGELSVGQQQRVAVARALLGKPDLLLADEPTSALDTDHREKFLKLLFELSDLYGTTVVFVSHDRSIEKLFTRSISLESINKVV